MEPMEPPVKRSNNGQLNLNTWLLTACVALSGWVLYSINQLDEKIAGMMPLINVNATAIESVNKVDEDQTRRLDDISTRLTKLETQSDLQKGKN
jgi:hypothetical protein